MTAGPVDDRPVTLAVLGERVDNLAAELNRLRDSVDRGRVHWTTVVAVIIAAAAVFLDAVPALAA